MTVASFFRKYSVGCFLNYVRLIITRQISYILSLATKVVPSRGVGVRSPVRSGRVRSGRSTK
jgi:hypothetical protein